jgi:hypothetical protein
MLMVNTSWYEPKRNRNARYISLGVSDLARATEFYDAVLGALGYIRQFELRALAAFRADVLSALARIFVEAIFTRHRAWAKRHGLGDAPSGAVLFVHAPMSRRPRCDCRHKAIPCFGTKGRRQPVEN